MLKEGFSITSCSLANKSFRNGIIMAIENRLKTMESILKNTFKAAKALYGFTYLRSLIYPFI
jgi:hypothetical protein